MGARRRGIPASCDDDYVSIRRLGMDLKGCGWEGRELVYFEFCKRKATAGAHTAVVFDAWAAHYGFELVDWAGREGCGFGETVTAAAGFAAWL